jgi:hypothetical protein
MLSRSGRALISGFFIALLLVRGLLLRAKHLSGRRHLHDDRRYLHGGGEVPMRGELARSARSGDRLLEILLLCLVDRVAELAVLPKLDGKQAQK